MTNKKREAAIEKIKLIVPNAPLFLESKEISIDANSIYLDIENFIELLKTFTSKPVIFLRSISLVVVFHGVFVILEV